MTRATMPFELADTSWTLQLYAYPDEAPPASVYAEFFERMTKLLEVLGAPPTYIGASGPGYPGKYVTYGGRVTKRLLDTSFADVHSVELVTTPPGSDAPAGDSFVVASLIWWDVGSANLLGLELSLTMNEAVLPLRSQRCEELLRELLVWRQWSFGFGQITHKDERYDDDARMVWWNAEAAQRRRTAWRALPVLALNEQQLAQPVCGKESFLGLLAGRRRIRTLADFIGAAEGTRSERIGGLLLWWIPPERLADIRDRLSGTPAVLPERLPEDWEPESASEASAESLPEPPAAEPPEPNPDRDALWELIRTQLVESPELLPVVSFEAFFEGNDEEDSIAPNQVGSGRPPLAEMYATLKQIAARADVQAVLVSIHDDSLYYLERGDTYGEPYGWPAAEHVILITTAAREEVERWVEDFGADSVDDGWPAAKHPAAPVPAPGHRVYTVVWD
jgi:hypothetical protein